MKKIEKFLNTVSTIGCALALSFMTIIIVLEIFLRIIGTSTLISDEFAGYAMVAIVFWGAVISFGDDKFVRVDAWYNSFKGKVKYWTDIAFHIVVLGYASVLTYYIWYLNVSSFLHNSKSYSIAEVPLSIPQFLMSLGMFFFDVYLFIKTIQLINRFGKVEQ